MLPLLVSIFTLALQAQAPRGPDIAAQKAAMKKLEFLTGKWSGDATIRTPQGERKFRQTEQVEYRLDGLVMLVEGTGRDPATGEILFNALATIRYDDAAKAYRIHAHNGGRYLDTELKVDPNAFEWGFTSGPAKIRNIMKLTESGDWFEYTEVTIGDRPPMRTVEFTVRK